MSNAFIGSVFAGEHGRESDAFPRPLLLQRRLEDDCVLGGHFEPVVLSNNRQSPRRDNSKGDIVVLFIANRVYQLILINTNRIFININDICIWIGVSKPHLRHLRLFAAVFLSAEQVV